MLSKKEGVWENERESQRCRSTLRLCMEGEMIVVRQRLALEVFDRVRYCDCIGGERMEFAYYKPDVPTWAETSVFLYNNSKDSK